MTYLSQASDTSEAADRFRFQLYRQRSLGQRLQLADRLRRQVRQLSSIALKQQFPDLSETEMARKIAETWLGDKCPPHWVPSVDIMTANREPIAIIEFIAEVLAAAEILYYVTGEMAAIAHGEPRATLDLDVVIAIDRSEIPHFVAILEGRGFYVAGSAEAMGGSLNYLNATHLENIENVDFIISEDTEYERLKFDRRQWYVYGNTSIAIASPEDIIISKLLWRRDSRSDKQWRDILGILKVQFDRLDFPYIQHWIDRFDLDTDWQLAVRSAGIELQGNR